MLGLFEGISWLIALLIILCVCIGFIKISGYDKTGKH